MLDLIPAHAAAAGWLGTAELAAPSAAAAMREACWTSMACATMGFMGRAAGLGEYGGRDGPGWLGCVG